MAATVTAASGADATPSVAKIRATPGHSAPVDAPLTRAQRFAANGYMAATPAFDAARMAEARAGFDGLVAEMGRSATQYGVHNRHKDLRWVYDLACAPEVLDVVEEILGPDITLLDSRFVCKHALTVCLLPYCRAQCTARQRDMRCSRAQPRRYCCRRSK